MREKVSKKKKSRFTQRTESKKHAYDIRYIVPSVSDRPDSSLLWQLIVMVLYIIYYFERLLFDAFIYTVTVHGHH